MWAILPLKDFVSAKRRLSGVLTAVERRRLFHAMVEDVLEALRSAESVSQIVIVSDDPVASLLAEHFGAILVDEPKADDAEFTLPQERGGNAGNSLNRAVEAACAVVPAGQSVLVLHADLPAITAEEIDAVFHSCQIVPGNISVSASDSVSCKEVVLVPDSVRSGTNAMLFAIDKPPEFLFGSNSFHAHSQMLARKGISFGTYESEAFSTDIDTARDLLLFLQRTANELVAATAPLERSNAAYLYCHENSIVQRLQMMWSIDHEEPEFSGQTDSQVALTDSRAALTDSRAVRAHHRESADFFNATEISESGLSAHSDIPNSDHRNGNTLQETPFVELSDEQALALAECDDLAFLMQRAASLRDTGHGNVISFSRKVFIPLTRLCRDVCHYCTFATTPKRVESPYLSVDEVLELAREADKAGCKEALFTLGEKPELRYSAARNALAEMGFSTTLEYVAHVAERVLQETSLLPHINAGCMDANEIEMLRKVSASMGIMLESSSERLCEKGMPHYGSPDKQPAARLETIRLAGEADVPFTSGILIGIGETRAERIESMLALRSLHQQYGHLQEVIVQNFRAKPDTKMSQAPDPSLDELLWTIAVARLVFGPAMHIQAPPNLSPGELEKIVAAGIDDWGGVSPLTPDHVNPEAPWPHLDALASQTRTAGKILQERLTIYPGYARQADKYLDAALVSRVLEGVDSLGWPREDEWVAGVSTTIPDSWQQHENVGLKVIQQSAPDSGNMNRSLDAIIARASRAQRLSEQEIVHLFSVRGDEFAQVCEAANKLRQLAVGDRVRYVVNRNINYTNICYFKCQFCAFSKGKMSENLRGKPYDLSHDEISRRSIEAWERGATEVCLQGGIHPGYTGQTYLDICHTIKQSVPEMHIHAFSPLEIWQGASTLGLDIRSYLEKLQAAGLSTLPGTAAEILDDDIREVLCPEKIRTRQWLHVMEAAHSVGMRTTATIMYGHIEQPFHWARHLLHIRDLQAKTGGFTEFVPLPFVPEEAPLYLKGRARKGPTFREAVLMHAVARLVLHGQIDNIQTSWVKMGEQGVQACLNAGANDLGGTLMNETITRSAGAQHGQEMPPAQMDAMIQRLERQPGQRNTCYGEPQPEQVSSSYLAKPLQETVNTSPEKIYANSELRKPGLDAEDELIAVAR